jgi:hypothetical protein
LKVIHLSVADIEEGGFWIRSRCHADDDCKHASLGKNITHDSKGSTHGTRVK